jgi:hypothetical protein
MTTILVGAWIHFIPIFGHSVRCCLRETRVCLHHERNLEQLSLYLPLSIHERVCCVLRGVKAVGQLPWALLFGTFAWINRPVRMLKQKLKVFWYKIRLREMIESGSFWRRCNWLKEMYTLLALRCILQALKWTTMLWKEERGFRNRI